MHSRCQVALSGVAGRCGSRCCRRTRQSTGCGRPEVGPLAAAIELAADDRGHVMEGAVHDELHVLGRKAEHHRGPALEQPEQVARRGRVATEVVVLGRDQHDVARLHEGLDLREHEVQPDERVSAMLTTRGMPASSATTRESRPYSTFDPPTSMSRGDGSLSIRAVLGIHRRRSASAGRCGSCAGASRARSTAARRTAPRARPARAVPCSSRSSRPPCSLQNWK